ncbi:MAG: phage major capsid protein [Armatimonadota bacterium]
MSEVMTAIERIATGFEEFKRTNDERLKQIETRGKADPLLEEKLDRINADLDRLQEMLQKGQRLPLPGSDGREQKGLTAEQLEHKTGYLKFLRKGNEDGLRDLEAKAMSVGSDPDGGYLVPADMTGRIVTKVYETSPMRQYAQVDTTSSDTYGGPTDLDEAGAGWVGETEDRDETDTPEIGEWSFPIHEIYAEPRQTQKFLDDAASNVEEWLARKLADKFARTENAAFINGNGVKKPRGLFSYETLATGDGVRAWKKMEHVLTGAAGDFAAADPGDVLFDVVGALKAAYRQGAVWVCNRSVVTKVRKFKDQNDQYLWQPSLQVGQPQTLLGFPIAEMEDVPALANGSLSMGFGNIKIAYQIADRIGIRTLRDPFTKKGWVKFYTTKRVGADVVNFEAFKFLKFGA